MHRHTTSSLQHLKTMRLLLPHVPPVVLFIGNTSEERDHSTPFFTSGAYSGKVGVKVIVVPSFQSTLCNHMYGLTLIVMLYPLAQTP